MDLLHLEQQRLALETNLQDLRLKLKHWQTWEAEYEGLKEEIQRSSEQLTSEELDGIAKSYNGDLVNQQTVTELLGLGNGAPRSSQQILGLIEKRQEYVQRNIDTLQRQFFDAEAKSEEMAFAARSHNEGSEAGLPLTEIHEELDDDDNVISSHLSQPEQSTADLVASLRKAGLNEGDIDPGSPAKLKVEELKPAITNASPLISPTTVRFETYENPDVPRSRTSSSGAEDADRPSIRKKSVSFSADTKPPEERQRLPSEDGRKSVSFAEKVAVMPAAPPADTRSVSFSPMIEEIPPQPLGPASPEVQATTNIGAQSNVKQVESPAETSHAGQGNGFVVPEDVIVPEDESPEDARTRREMLEYHLNEVGNVVAQIDLDDPEMEIDDDEEDDSSSFFTSSEHPEDEEDTPYTTGLSDSDDSEDQFGRTKRRVVSPQYQKQMEELQRRLIGNLGPQPMDEEITEVDTELDPKDVRRLVIREKRSSASSVSSDNSDKKLAGKKRVSFAESLDVAEVVSPPLKAQKVSDGENAAPITTNVMERSTATSHSLPQGVATERKSRFKKDRAAPITDSMDGGSALVGSTVDEADVDERPTGPAGVTIANTLTERMPNSKAAVAPSLDDPDPELERRALATEYYRQRNDIVKQQGGFNSTADEDEGLGELMEERDGKLKKVSRFKAARIKPQ